MEEQPKLSLKEQAQKMLPKEAFEIVPETFWNKVSQKPAGNILLFPDLDKLFVSILESTTKENIEKKNVEIEKEGMKMFAVKTPVAEEGGGVLSYLTNKNEAYRGLPHVQAINTLGTTKKIIPVMMKVFKEIILLVLFPLLFKKRIRNIIEILAIFFANGLSPFRLKPQFYCRFVQEIQRAMNIVIERNCKTKEDKRLARHISTTTQTGIEFDNAYRFRVQDWFNAIDVRKLCWGNRFVFVKELRRSINVMIKRENIRHEKIFTLKVGRELVCFVCFFHSDIRHLIQEFFQQFDMEKAKFTPEDYDFLSKRPDYMFEGKMTYRMKEMWENCVKDYTQRIEEEETKAKISDRKYHNQLKKMWSKERDIVIKNQKLYENVEFRNP